MREKKTFCYYFCDSLAKEFQWNKFMLNYDPIEVFFKSQWQKQNKAIWWLIYRWCLAINFCLGVCGSLVLNFNNGKWFIYLTNWGFFLCMSSTTLGAILASIYHFKTTPSKWITKSYWVMHWSTLVLATVISFVYWIFLFPGNYSFATVIHKLTKFAAI